MSLKYNNPALDFQTKMENLPVDFVYRKDISLLDFSRITHENVIKQAIAKGIQEGLFRITDKVQRIKDKPAVAKEHVTMGKEIPTEEIDLHSGYIVSPDVISICKFRKKEGTYIIYNMKEVNRQQLYCKARERIR